MSIFKPGRLIEPEPNVIDHQIVERDDGFSQIGIADNAPALQAAQRSEAIAL